MKAALIEWPLEPGLKPKALNFVREEYPKGTQADVLETVFYKACNCLLDKNAPAPQAVCISSAGPNIIPVTEKGRPLSGLWWFSPACREERLKSFFLPYILHQKKHKEQDFIKTAFYFSCQEYLCWKLGSQAVTTLPSPEYEPFYWEKAELKKIGVEASKFPPFAALGSVSGRVSAEAAAKSGLPEGTAIVPGGTDFIMALIGCGVVFPGLVCDRAGSSEGINVCVEDADVSRLAASGIRVLPHVLKGRWNISVVIPESGALFEDYRRRCGLCGLDYAPLLTALLPDYGGPDDMEEAPKLPDGVIKKGEAVLNTIAGKVCDALDLLQKSGFNVTEMTVSGGQAKNARWNRYKAEKTGCRLYTPPVADAELAGDAVCAAIAAGAGGGIEEVCRAILAPNRAPAFSVKK